jgi:hypothetical protein
MFFYIIAIASQHNHKFILVIVPLLTGWTTEVNGGGLRAFPQSRAVAGPPSGSDNGNLQVRILVSGNCESVSFRNVI